MGAGVAGNLGRRRSSGQPGSRNRLYNLLLTSAAVLGCTPAGAADWLGTTSSDWFVTGNWNPATVPGSATDVTINNGGTPNPANITATGAQARNVTLGSNAGQTGTLNVTGGGLAVGTTLTVGDFGTGTVNISAGGTVNTGSAYVAVDPSGSGTITVTGAGSKLTASGTYIGMDANAIGQVTVQNSASLASGTTVIGFFTGTSNGTLTVSGSTFTNTGSFTIGERGTGTFNLNNGSTATSGTTSIGSSNASGNGTANISGSGTTWTTSNMNLGTVGAGTLTISDGAHVTSNRSLGIIPVVSIGGNATVTGSGSQWLIDGSQGAGGPQGTLGIGKANSTSSLTISAGGTLRINNNATGTDGSSSDVRIGVATGSTGNVTVTGANSTMTTPYNVHVGYGTNSTGNVTVSNGGALNTGFTILGGGTGATGNVTVTGAGSTWTITDTPNAIVGQAQGLSIALGSSTSKGTLTIADGGTVNVTSRNVNLGGLAGSQATLNIGAAAASPAAAAGTLNANAVVFVDGATSTINFNHTSSNYIFATSISGNGPGAVNFLAGTTILTGNNTYIGTTTISSGATAQLGNGGNAGGSNGLVSGNITNNGALIFNVASLLPTYGGVISGNGTVEQRGSSTLILTGTNTYAGLTTISAGTLQIGNGGTTGSIAGDLLNNSAIDFNRSNNFSFNKVISGTGSLNKRGAGIMTLNGVATYTGGTSVQQGTLRLGGSDRLAATGSLFLFSTGTFDLNGFNQTVSDLSGPGTVAAGTGTFTAGGTNNRTFAGTLTGSGAFVKQGSGSLSLTGTTTGYTGTTTVSAGTLSVNSDLSGSTVTVNAGATLGGSGTVGATTVNGNIAPGNSIDTIHIVGPYTQASGSTYTVEINNAGQSDLIAVTGAATIQSGTTVAVVGTPGLYTLNQRYTILTATGGVTGQYTTLTDNLPFVDFTLGSDANSIFFDVLRNTVSFDRIAQTPNQQAAAGGAQSLGTGNRIFDTVLMLDGPNARRAFDLLSGEIHASVSGTILEDSRFIRDAVTGRLRQGIGGTASIFAPQLATLNFGEDDSGGGADVAGLMFEGNAMSYASGKRKRVRGTMDRALPLKAAPAPRGPVYTAWGQAFGNFGRTDGNGNAAALRRTTGGFITGMDVTTRGSIGDVWRAGLAVGFQHTSVDVTDRSSLGGVETYYLAAYGGRQIGALGLRAGASYGWHDISTNRSIVVPGFNDSTKGRYNANTAQVFGEVGYGMQWRQFAIEPFAGIAYVNLHTDSFVEGVGAAALAGAGGTTDTTYSTIGLRAAAPLPWRDFAGLVAKGSIGWRHNLGTSVPTAQLSFASGSAPFIVAGVPIARDAAAIELGLEGTVWRNATLGIAYTGQIAGSADDHGVNANFVQKF